MKERPTAECIVNLVDTVQVAVVNRDAGKHFTEQALRPIRGPQQIGMNEARPSGQIDDAAKLKPRSEEVGQPIDGEEAWKDQLAGEPDGARFHSQEIALHPAAQLEAVGVVE